MAHANAQSAPFTTQQKINAVVLWFAGLQFLLFAGVALIFPKELMQAVDIHAVSANALSEVRAFYGGLELALGALLCFGGLHVARQRPALVLQAASFLCVGLVRGLSMLLAQSSSTFLIVACISELFLAALAYWALRRSL